MSTFTIGIDPDLHKTAVAVVLDGELVEVGTIKVAKALTGWLAVTAMAHAIQEELSDLPARVIDRHLSVATVSRVHGAVEAPRLAAKAGMRHARPDDIVRLSAVSGAALAALGQQIPVSQLHAVPPASWKGQRSKVAGQRFVLRDLALEPVLVGSGTNGYCKPKVFDGHVWMGHKQADWRHIADAAGIALYQQTGRLAGKR